MENAGRDSIAVSYKAITGKELSVERTDRVALAMAENALQSMLGNLAGGQSSVDSSFLEQVNGFSFEDKVVAALIFAQYKQAQLLSE